MKYLIYIYLLFSFSTHAIQQFEVTKDNAVSVIINGAEEYLFPGDTFELGKVAGWKREITILHSTNSRIKTSAAAIGNNRFLEIKDEFLKEIKSGPVLDQTKSKVLSVTAPIIVKIANGKSIELNTGDRLEIGNKNGWKREVKIIRNDAKNMQEGYLGDKTYDDYLENGVLVDAVSTSKKYLSLDNLIANLSGEDTESDEDEYEQNLKAATCPENDKTYKLSRAVSIISMPGKISSIPEESIIQSIKTENGACYLKLLKLPEGSNLSLNDYPTFAVSYPVNFPPDNLEEVEDYNSRVSLEKGFNLKLTPGIQLRAIGRKTGKSYTFNSRDKVVISGIHANGDYIVKRNGERHEYRISKDSLDELNQQGGLEINFESTVGDLSKNNSFNEVISFNDDEGCRDIEEVVEDVDYGESYEACVNSDVRTKKGVIKANNYLTNLLGLANYNPEKDLKNSNIENYSKCIARSMKHGTSRNTTAICKKDNDGKYIEEGLRAVKKNSKGKKYTTLKNFKPRGCASKKTSTFLAKRFLDAAKCLDLNPKEIFPIINHESHFQPTAVSPTFALGVGQIVYSNYTDFYEKFNEMKSLIGNKNSLVKEARSFATQEGYNKFAKSNTVRLGRYSGFMLSHLQDKVANKSNECSGLREMYNNPYKVPGWAKNSDQKFGLYKRHESERLCTPKNPDEGFYISMIYYQYSKKHARYEIDKLNEKISPKMSDSKKEAFAKITAQWMYNGGGDGILSVLEIFNNDLNAGKVEVLNNKGIALGGKLSKRNINSLSAAEFKNYFSHYLKYRYGNSSQTRRDEVAKYVPGIGGTGGIDGDMRKIESKGMSLCGE